MVDKLPKYRRGIGTGRTIAPNSGVPAGVASLPHHSNRRKRLCERLKTIFSTTVRRNVVLDTPEPKSLKSIVPSTLFALNNLSYTDILRSNAEYVLSRPGSQS